MGEGVLLPPWPPTKTHWRKPIITIIMKCVLLAALLKSTSHTHHLLPCLKISVSSSSSALCSAKDSIRQPWKQLPVSCSWSLPFFWSSSLFFFLQLLQLQLFCPFNFSLCFLSNPPLKTPFRAFLIGTLNPPSPKLIFMTRFGVLGLEFDVIRTRRKLPPWICLVGISLGLFPLKLST